MQLFSLCASLLITPLLIFIANICVYVCVYVSKTLSFHGINLASQEDRRLNDRQQAATKKLKLLPSVLRCLNQ